MVYEHVWKRWKEKDNWKCSHVKSKKKINQPFFVPTTPLTNYMVNFNYTSQEFWVSIETPPLFLFVCVFILYIYFFTENKYTPVAQVLSSNINECSSIVLSYDTTVGWICNSGLTYDNINFNRAPTEWNCDNGAANLALPLCLCHCCVIYLTSCHIAH